MKNVVYTTSKYDVWASDVNDLLDALHSVWKPVRFEVDEKDNDMFDILAVDDRFEEDEGNKVLFSRIVFPIEAGIRMWIEGHSTGKYKQS